MSNTVIRAENLGKKYLIGRQKRENYTTLRDVLTDGVNSFVRKIKRRRIDESNTSQQEFWALKDVSFEIERGDRVGIIGHNGAGKSTLLKILSRITEPTEGRIRMKGRIASLLEVGTGFHPELTGRENIYLNGAILGMSKAEVKLKFDEIVDFSEVEKFLDTPVKRYSSGMYVRLAFAVAAHLEPEILIVDEVLAVGDAQFQKKCLGKMESVGREGRTVLFVSHNMAAVRTLCSRAILMKDGQVVKDEEIETAIGSYLLESDASEASIVWDEQNAPQSPEMRFVRAHILNEAGEQTSLVDCRKEFSIVVEYKVLKSVDELRIGFFMQNSDGIPVCGSNEPSAWFKSTKNPGFYTAECVFPGYVLNAGRYLIRFGSDLPPFVKPLVTTPFCLSLTVEDVEGHGLRNEKLPGIVRPKLEWNSENKTKLS
jgi:lipopolysaccharide transport system ATP-binding protein